ncbi:MAG: hypothetical protein ACRC9X_01505 [Bacteroidales bacterium]
MPFFFVTLKRSSIEDKLAQRKNKLMQVRTILSDLNCASKEKIQGFILRCDEQSAKKNKDLSAVKTILYVLVLPFLVAAFQVGLNLYQKYYAHIVGVGVFAVGVLIAGVIVLRALLESLFYPKRANYQCLKEDLQDLLYLEEEKNSVHCTESVNPKQPQ